LSWIPIVFENFSVFTIAMPIQGCGVPRNRRLFGGVGCLTTLGVGYFVWRRLRKSNWITFTSHS